MHANCKTRIIIMLLFTILLSISVIATTVYDGTIKEGEQKDIGGKTVEGTYYETNNKLSLHIIEDDAYLLLPEGDCDYMGLWEFCFKSAVEAEEEIEKNGYTFLKSYHSIDIEVRNRAPDISIELTAEQEEASLGEGIDITATVTNSGDLDAGTVDVQIQVPEGILASSTIGTVMGSFVYDNFILRKETSQTLKATIRGRQYGNFVILAKVTYEENGQKKELEDELSIKIPFPYTVSLNANPELIDPYEPSNISVTITNEHPSENIDLETLEIRLPKNLDVLSMSEGLLKKIYVLKTTGENTISDKLQHWIKVQSPKKGEYPIEVYVKVNAGRETFEETYNTNLGIGVPPLIPLIEMEQDSLEAYESSEVKIYLYNRNTINMAAEGTIKSDLFSNTKAEDLILLPGEKTLVFENTINAPRLENGKASYIVFEGEYIDENNRTRQFYEKKDISILPPERVVNLSQKVHIEGSHVNVEVFMKNIGDIPLKRIEIFDLLPKEFKIISGEQTTITNLATGQEKLILNYTASVPSTYQGASFIVDHTVNAIDNKDNLRIQEILLPGTLKGIEKEQVTEPEETKNNQVTEGDEKSEIQITEESKNTTPTETPDNKEETEEPAPKKTKNKFSMIKFLSSVGMFFINIFS